jgi:hypothetical protein
MLAVIAGPRIARCQAALPLAAPQLAVRKVHSPDIATDDLLWLIAKVVSYRGHASRPPSRRFSPAHLILNAPA